MSGCSGEPEPQAVVEALEEQKPKRGASAGTVDPEPVATLLCAVQSLEVEVLGCGSRAIGERTGINGKGARALDERAPLRGERSP